MSDLTAYTAEDREMFRNVDQSDLPETGPPPIRLLQSNSGALVRGDDKYVPGAQAGQFLGWRDDRPVLRDVLEQVQPIFFRKQFVEKDRDGGYIGPLAAKPLTHWVRVGPKNERGQFDNDTGHRIDEELHANFLYESVLASFVFRSKAQRIGEDWSHRAAAIRSVDKERYVAGAIAGLWRLSSRLVQQDGNSWYVPAVVLIGRYGEAGGPTLAQARFAAALRGHFRRGEPWADFEPPAPPPIAPPKATMTVTSGPAALKALRAEEPPPIEDYDGPEPDDVSFDQ